MNLTYRVLVISALLLGLLAMVVRSPKESQRVTLDLKELSRIIEREEDHVTPEELADMLMEGRRGVLVVDVRDSAAFVSYHIPSAVRYDISKLIETPLSMADTIVVYSEGGIHVAQVWMLLSAKGHRNVFTLRGGLNEWSERILFPVVSAELAVDEKKRIEKRALFFGGEPRGLKTAANPEQNKRKPSVTPNLKIMKEQEKQREVC
ncbi:MAG: rhodanese-like domain-containing protein [Ignavibacteriales bacterium]|nr:rhodanese-like domain-containing protein [Ignavibacteriales bacterium]